MADKKHLVFAIIKFLEEERTQFGEDLAESLEVAQQCLESAYEVSSTDAACEDRYPLPDSLLQIFAHGLEATPQKEKTPEREVSPASKAEAEDLKAKGNECMKDEKFEEAIEQYTKAIEKDMNNAVYYCNRAAAYSKLDKNQEAIADCAHSLRIDPSYSKAYGRKGLAHSALNQHPEAKDCYIKAIQLDPDNASYKQNLEITEQKIRESNPMAGLNLGGMDFSGLLNNPALMNMATGMMTNPQVQSMMANMMSGTAQEEGGPQNISGLLQAGQQLAQQMQQSNPELVAQLRTQMRGDEPPPQPDGEN